MTRLRAGMVGLIQNALNAHQTAPPIKTKAVAITQMGFLGPAWSSSETYRSQ